MPGSETGYAKNAANLQDLIIRLKTLGADYNPPKALYTVKSLEQLTKKVNNAMHLVNQVLPVYRKAVDEQELTFKPLNKLITRSYNYLKVAINNPAELQTARTLADHLRGVPIKNTVDGISRKSKTNTSYDHKLAFFKQYINVLIVSGVYEPAEKDLKLTSFQTLLNAMESNVTAVAIAKIPVDDARKKRFTLFYAEQIGLVDIAMGIKSYIKSLLSKDHPQYRHIVGLTFRKMSL